MDIVNRLLDGDPESIRWALALIQVPATLWAVWRGLAALWVRWTGGADWKPGDMARDILTILSYPAGWTVSGTTSLIGNGISVYGGEGVYIAAANVTSDLTGRERKAIYQAAQARLDTLAADGKAAARAALMEKLATAKLELATAPSKPPGKA